MRYIYIQIMLLVFFLSGCSKEQKVIHNLDCVVKNVHNNKTGKTVEFKREEAIENGFVYHFRIHEDVLVVNNVDIYVKDKNGTRSYSLKRESNVDTNMKYMFNKTFDDVRFLLIDKNIEYGYNCSDPM